jgi:hypothetical protein
MHVALAVLPALFLALKCQAGSRSSEKKITPIEWNLRGLADADAIAGESFTVSFCLPDP